MDNDCVCDALLDDVVQQGQADRLAIRDVYDNPEKAWLDGYVAGWFAGHFKALPVSIALPQEEEREVCAENELVSS